MGIVNVVGSTLSREIDAGIYNYAGPEIGVASTKAFTSQLVTVALLALFLGRQRGMSLATGQEIIKELKRLPDLVRSVLQNAGEIRQLAEKYRNAQNFFYVGRKYNFPIALEGALKLKEISYIHAEAYPAGELKHGPLALIDAEMPVIVVAPQNDLIEKLKSNVEEVRARGGLMYVFADSKANFTSDETMKVIDVPVCDDLIAPIVYTLPLQLLSYYVAIIKGTDVDQPRNLAKSVTVE